MGTLALLVAACAPAESTLVVQVRTDLAPGADFMLIRTIATAAGGDPVTVDVLASSTRAWGSGVRVAELPGLPAGDYSLLVQVLDSAGERTMERPVRIELEGALRVVTVLLSRDCQGVVCSDAGASACLGGRCVPDDCHEESPLACGDPDCVSDAECAVSGECTATGVCFTTLDHAGCASGVCDGSTGMCTDPPTPDCSPRTVPSACGDQAVVRARVFLGEGMVAMTGTVRVTLAHSSLGSLTNGGVFHTDSATSGTISSTQAVEVQFDFCAGGEMWSEENGGYNLWAYLDENSNEAFDLGEVAGKLEMELSCHATESPCHTIVLDCVDGYSCIEPAPTECACDTPACDGVGGPSRIQACGC